MQNAAQLSVEAVTLLKQDIGIPATLAEIGVPAEALEGIVRAASTYRQLGNSPRPLTGNDLHLIVSQALAL